MTGRRAPAARCGRKPVFTSILNLVDGVGMGRLCRLIHPPRHHPSVDRSGREGDQCVDEIAAGPQGNGAQGMDGGQSNVASVVREHRSVPFQLNRCFIQPTIRTMTTLYLENLRNGH